MTLSGFLKTATSCGAALALACTLSHAADGSFIGSLSTVNRIASTVPGNGDVNPYGVAVVPRSTGNLVKGHILISNFNNSANLQGTGTTIVDVSPSGALKVFAQLDASTLPGACPGGVGLTTALVVLKSGWVIVGSLPTSNGNSATAKAGCLIVLNNMGVPVETIAGSKNGAAIAGPWDMTAYDSGSLVELFVTNVLIGTVAAKGNVVHQGTVVRILLLIDGDSKPQEFLRTVIGSGFPQRTDPAALVLGPTGVALGADGTLYVADTLASRIAAIPDALVRFTSAGVGHTVAVGTPLNQPLGLAIAPNGNILAVNAGNGNIVETTTSGTVFAPKYIDTSKLGPGTLFGLAMRPDGKAIYFVDDGDNTLDLLF